MWLRFLIQVGIFTSAALLVQKLFLFKRWSFVYLVIIPGVMFWTGDFLILIWGLLISLLMYGFWRTRRFVLMAIVVALVGLGVLFWGRVDQPRLASEIGIINQLRGEHLIVGEKMLGRFLHNKLDLFYFAQKRFEQKVGPTAVFTSGKYVYLASFFPVGYLFWWDLIFL